MHDDDATGPAVRLEPGDITARLSLPLRVRVQGIEAVLVSAEAYDTMLRAAQKKVEGHPKASRGRPHRLTRLDKDAELQRFLMDRLGTDDVDNIRRAAIERFGSARVPSRSAVNRFAVRTRAHQRSGGA